MSRKKLEISLYLFNTSCPMHADRQSPSSHSEGKVRPQTFMSSNAFSFAAEMHKYFASNFSYKAQMTAKTGAKCSSPAINRLPLLLLLPFLCMVSQQL